MIHVKVNAKGTLGSIEKIIDGIDEAVERGLSRTAFKGQEVAKSKSKGSVSKAIGVSQTQDGYELQARAPHSVFVERGRGPVQAKPGGVLRFVVAGRVVFAKRVRAARPRPFMAPAHRVMNKSRFVEQELSTLIRGA